MSCNIIEVDKDHIQLDPACLKWSEHVGDKMSILDTSQTRTGDWLIDWLIDWLSEWVSEWVSEWLLEWLIDWLIDWVSDCLIDWLIEWVIASVIAWLLDWLIDWVSEWVIAWVIDWLIDWLSEWLLDWLIEWVIASVIAWLLDWLIDWLIYLLIHFINWWFIGLVKSDWFSPNTRCITSTNPINDGHRLKACAARLCVNCSGCNRTFQIEGPMARETLEVWNFQRYSNERPKKNVCKTFLFHHPTKKKKHLDFLRKVS